MIVEALLFILALVLSIPLWVISCELVISFFHKSVKGVEQSLDISQVKFKILIPAHNEATIIEKTLLNLLHEDIAPNNIVVVADNCTDLTAEVAKSLSVVVLERTDTEKRGKGFALDYGINYLKATESLEVLIVLDADCETTLSSIRLLVHTCKETARPQQALYLMRNYQSTTLKQKVAGFAWLVKNKIRSLAVQKLGFPATLTGTGMAFPWHEITTLNIANGNIVEDMQLGIDCTLAGFAPEFCPEAIVYSDFPEQEDAEKTQRTRWEHGHLMTIFQQVPKLIKQSILQKNWRLLALALDIGVPPLALLVLLTVSGLVITGVYALFFGGYVAFYTLLLSFFFFAMILIVTWWRFGQDYLTFKELMGIPIYIISKLSVYSSFLFKRQTAWVKTSRKPKNKEP